MRKAFDGTNLLPYNVLWRTKEAFSDGVSGNHKSWFEVIDDKIVERFGTKYDKNPTNLVEVNKPMTREQRYYRDIFQQYYPNHSCLQVVLQYLALQ